MAPESRVRFGKIHAIEWNVKAKDMGMVTAQDMSKLLAYHEEERKEAL